jgi:GNAT superfamily N-acetyltransferase
MPTDEFLFGTELAEVERDFIQRSLEKHGNLHAPGLNARPVEVTLRDQKGQLIGGLLGSTAWEWLIVDMLWIAEEQRSRGLGGELLARAEQRAIKLGCTRARAETFDFQALPFYQKQGYDVYAQQDDFPVGHTEFQVRKNLG